MNQQKKLGKVKGKVIAITDKAVLIQLTTGQETWLPISRIHSKNNYNLKDSEQEFLVEDWILEKNKIPLDFLIDSLIQNIKIYHGDNLVSIYGIGSYFNDNLPDSWQKNDLDIIVIVKSIEDIDKDGWNNRFKSRIIEGYQVYIGYNTIEMYQNKEAFSKYSGANYKWALMDVSNLENSTLLYGEDIQDKLPDPNNIKFDYDDILARGLYHLEKSLKEKDEKTAKSAFSKAVFKISFYLCIFIDKDFPFTSVLYIKKKLEFVTPVVKHIEKILDFLRSAMDLRVKETISRNFSQLRENFIKFIFSLLEHGGLHKKFSVPKLNMYLAKYFGGFPLLKRFLKELH